MPPDTDRPVTVSGEVAIKNLIYVALFLLLGVAWLVAAMMGGLAAIRESLRPYLPHWVLLLNLALLPLAVVLAGIRRVPLGTNLVFWCIGFWLLVPLTGLTVKTYPVLTGLSRLSVWLIVFVFVPKWNYPPLVQYGKRILGLNDPHPGRKDDHA